MNQNYTLGKWISLLYRYGHIYIGKKLDSYAISKGQYIVLNALYKKDGVSQEDISDYLKIDKGTTAKVLKQLEKDGFIIRTVDPDDKRHKVVLLTQKAAQIKPVIREAMEGWNSVLWKGFSQEEKELLLSMVNRLADNAISSIENDCRAK